MNTINTPENSSGDTFSLQIDTADSAPVEAPKKAPFKNESPATSVPFAKFSLSSLKQ
jgi:hypothetical protein